MSQSRREFLKRGCVVGGVGLLSFTIGGCEKKVTPAEARKEGAEYSVLGEDEVQTLEAFGEVLLPGSAEAGLAHFVDHQLGATTADCMLMIRYLGVPPPFQSFYQGGLAALDKAAIALHTVPFAELIGADKQALVAQMAGGEVAAWEGPPPGFFYFVLRSDAVDVVYGTQEGFSALGIPYMAHIEPQSRWGE